MPTFSRRSLLQLSAIPFVPVPQKTGRRRRSDGFFGLHFDLHPTARDKILGRDLSDAHAAWLLDAVAPDFLQYDCKGHAGWLGYRSMVSDSSPGIVNDSLAIWRRATRTRGIPLVIHFSGVWDSLAIQQNPEWARVAADGARDDRATSTFGPYVRERMIPQLHEAISKYDLDGVWVDGDCWSARPDYSSAAVSAWKKRTGTDAPRAETDANWLAWLEFNRNQFLSYVGQYVNAIHKKTPHVQVASNWLYSTLVPVKPSLAVDFLSGDYLGNAPVSKARLEARYLAQTGKPWDLMAWGFQQSSRKDAGPVFKPAVQLMQEASVVLAQGGGFQIYYQPTRAGHFDPRLVEVMKRVAHFCRQRQALSHRTTYVPQVGVLFCGQTMYRTGNRLFGGWGALSNPASGWVDLLVENHHSVDVVADWNLDMISRTPLLVVPDWSELGEDTVAAVNARRGPTVICGAENVRSFAKTLAIPLRGEAQKHSSWLAAEEVPVEVGGLWQEVESGWGEVRGLRHPSTDLSQGGVPAALRRNNILLIPGPIGQMFATTHAPALRTWVGTMLEPIFQSRVRTTAPPTVELALRQRPGKPNSLLVHLINTTGMQVADDYAAVDFIAPLSSFSISCSFTQRPKRVTWNPGAADLPVNWNNGYAEVTIPSLEIHGIVEFEI